MLKTILSAACASALLAGAAFAQSASSPQDSTVKDPARMEKPGWTNQGSSTQPYPSKSGAPSGFDKSEQRAMDAASGKATMDRRNKSSASKASSRGATGASAGSSSSIAPQCSSMGREEDMTRCLNRHMAELAERGESPQR